MSDSAFGQRFPSNQRFGWTVFILAILALGGDLLLSRESCSLTSLKARPLILIVVVVVFLHLFNGNWQALGLRLTAKQGFRYWVRVTVVVFCIVIFSYAAVLVGSLAVGRPIPVYATSPHDLVSRCLDMWLYYPIIEEGVYRLIVCVGVATVFGRWPAIIVSGFSFAFLHWVYGNPSPENQIAGFLLAWAFFKSETIIVPFALHILGNIGALLVQVATWYWLQS